MADVPRLFNGDGGILATNFAVTWLGIVVVMVFSMCAAGAAVFRSYAAR